MTDLDCWDRDFCPYCGEEAEQYRKARHCEPCVLTWDGAYLGRDPGDAEIDYRRDPCNQPENIR